MAVEELPSPLCNLATDDGWRPVWESDSNVGEICYGKKAQVIQSAHSVLSPAVAVYGWRRTA